MVKVAHPLQHLLRDNFVDINWEDQNSALDFCLPILDSLANQPSLMVDALEYAFEHDPVLLARSEIDHFLDRAVLFEDHSLDCSIRLQKLHAGDGDRPHNHRASFATLILQGEYRHAIHSHPADLDYRQQTPPMTVEEIEGMKTVIDRVEKPGSYYAIHHSLVHSTRPTKDHLSVLIRGPSVKTRNFFFDEKRKQSFWHVSTQDETEEAIAGRQMRTFDRSAVETMIERLSQI